MADSSRAVLIVVDTSWNAVDWILPVAVKVRKQLGHRVLLFFKHEFYRDRGDRYVDLSRIVDAHCEAMGRREVLQGLSLRQKWQLARKRRRSEQEEKGTLRAALRWLRRAPRLLLPGYIPAADSDIDESLVVEQLAKKIDVKIDYLFHDFHNNERLYELFPDARVVLFPHGTNWTVSQHVDRAHELEANRLGKLPPQSIILAGSREDGAYRRLAAGSQGWAAGTGHPKLDPEWLVQFGTTVPSESKKRVLFITMPEHKAGSVDLFRRLVRQVVDAVGRHEAELMIKLHPNQSEGQIESVLTQDERRRVTWCNETVAGAARRCQAVISFPSSAVMDAVAADAPVTEFFDYAGATYGSFLRDGERATSIYRQEGLVEATNNEVELDQFLRLTLAPSQDRENLVLRQAAVLDARLGDRHGATERIIDLLWGENGAPREWSGLLEKLGPDSAAA